MRGTPSSWLSLSVCLRFIPAFAGNTCIRSTKFCSGTVHPRVCGEHGLALGITRQGAGSSPRLRGTLEQGKSWSKIGRFIPAFAGNTRSRPTSSPLPPVHPRVCGEHSCQLAAIAAQHGSSPRLRGTPRRTEVERIGHRFIPAFAGNTTRATGRTDRPAVHPRVCGEHPVHGT